MRFRLGPRRNCFCLLLPLSLIALAGCGGSHSGSSGSGPAPSPFAATHYVYQRQIPAAVVPGDIIGVALDGQSNIYALGLNHVQKFKLDGTFLKIIGNSGSSSGKLQNVSGIAFDTADVLYAVDSIDCRIEKLSADGVFLGQFGSSGTGDGQLRGPRNVALDSAGNVYVTDYANDRVEKFKPDGTFLAKFGATTDTMVGPVGGSGDGQLHLPVGVAVDGSGHVYVTDSGNFRVEVFNADGTFRAKFGSVGTGNGQFGPDGHNGLPSGPAGIALDGAGNVYVMDLINNRVEKFSAEGVYLAQFSATGGGPSSFPSPGLTLDADGNVYLAIANRVNIYKPVL